MAAGGQLFEEERVALAALVQAGGLVRRRRTAQQVGEQVGDGGQVETDEVDPLDAARQLGDEGAERVRAVQLVGPVGGDDEDGGVAEGAVRGR